MRHLVVVSLLLAGVALAAAEESCCANGSTRMEDGSCYCAYPYYGQCCQHNAMAPAAETTTSPLETTTSSGCKCPKSEYTTASGTLASPKYPVSYCAKMSCFYSVTVPLGKVIQMRIVGWLGKGDVLVVMHPSCRTEHKFVTLKNTFDEVVYSHANGFELHFLSDSADEAMGFEAVWTSIDKSVMPVESPSASVGRTPTYVRVRSFSSSNDESCQCPDPYGSGEAGHFQSPIWLEGTCAFVTCEYDVLTEPGFVIHLTISGNAGTGSANVIVFDTACPQNPESGIPMLTGKIPTSDYYSIDSYMGVNFMNGIEGMAGTKWSAKWKAIPTASYPPAPLPPRPSPPPCACPDPTHVYGGASGFFVSPGYPYTYCDSLNCTYIVETPGGTVLHMDIIAETWRGHDFVFVDAVFDGRATTRKAYSGYVHERLETKSNRATVHFATDVGGTRNLGFHITYAAVINATAPGRPV